MAALVRQLLAFARKQTAAPKVLDLNKTVAGILKMLHPLIGEDIDLAAKVRQVLEADSHFKQRRVPLLEEIRYKAHGPGQRSMTI